jgi:hypothetical protein
MVGNIYQLHTEAPELVILLLLSTPGFVYLLRQYCAHVEVETCNYQASLVFLEYEAAAKGESKSKKTGSSTNMIKTTGEPGALPRRNTIFVLPALMLLLLLSMAENTSLLRERAKMKGLNTVASVLVEKILVPDQAEKTINDLIDFKLSQNLHVRDEFKHTNASPILVHAIEHYNDSIDIQWKCLLLMVDLTYEDNEGHFTKALNSVDAPIKVVKAMTSFPQHKETQRYGSASLCNLAAHMLSGAKQVVEAGGIEAVLAAMESHTESTIQLEGVRCLGSIAFQYPSSTHAISERGGVEAVLRAMSNHPEDEQVQKFACLFLEKMIGNHKNGRNLIRQQNGSITLAKVEHRFRGKNNEIAQQAASLLKKLLG